MRSRTDFKPLGSLDPLLDYPALAPICIRPEVPRISSDAEHVTNKSIGVNKFDAKLFTASKMNETVMLDLKVSTILKHFFLYNFIQAAKPMAMQDWNNLEKEDINGIYKFPFSGSEELSHYFGENDFQVGVSFFLEISSQLFCRKSSTREVTTISSQCSSMDARSTSFQQPRCKTGIFLVSNFYLLLFVTVFFVVLNKIRKK